MNKKKLIVFASYVVVRAFNTKELIDFFGDLIEIESYHMNENINKRSITGDLVVTFGTVDIPTIRQYLKYDIEIITGTRTILIESYNRLKSLPDNTDVIVANTYKRAAFELTALLIGMGINHLNFYPIYNGIDKIPDIKTVIIPMAMNELDFDFKDKIVIDLKSRRITPETYKLIILFLDISNSELNTKLVKCSSLLLDFEYQNISIANIYYREKLLASSLNEINDGLVIISKNNEVMYANNVFLDIIKFNGDYRNLKLDENLIYLSMYEEICQKNIINNKLIYVKEIDKEFLISKKFIDHNNSNLGYIIVLKNVMEIERLENHLRIMNIKKGYVAKYRFDDILGNSRAIIDCISIAKKLSLIDRDLLITGESGTGKEIFAQSIHNYSKRHNKPFVAINCASLSSELLNSELFGYDDGAFTGARKGGKKGLFELAHKGTIFLDEIGDISPDVQIKLLRVIQEKEIRRIGGEEIIPVDIRIITATNKNLEILVSSGAFRLDLYFRLCAFTLVIPPLRDRLEDIELIIQNTFDKLSCPYKKLTSELISVLKNHDWKGNVRELINCAEYMAYIDHDVLSYNDLPPNINKLQSLKVKEANDKEGPKLYTEKVPAEVKELYGFSNNEKAIILFVLQSLLNKNLGRNRLYKLCLENGFNMTEYRLRMTLEYLNSRGYIKYGDGRHGSSLTYEGNLLINQLISE